MPLGWLLSTMTMFSSYRVALTFRICILPLFPSWLIVFDRHNTNPRLLHSISSPTWVLNSRISFAPVLCIMLVTFVFVYLHWLWKEKLLRKSLYHFFLFFLNLSLVYSIHFCLLGSVWIYVSVERLFMGSVSLWKWISKYKFICFYSLGTDVKGM